MTRSEKNDATETNRKKIAILVPNPCNPDYRVIKHAEFFERQGYDVRVYCRWAEGLPYKQVINNVTYIRRPITARSFLIDLFKSIFQRKQAPVFQETPSLVSVREKNNKIIETMKL